MRAVRHMGSWKEEVVTRGSPFSVEKDADTFTESAARSKKRDGRETDETKVRSAFIGCLEVFIWRL